MRFYLAHPFCNRSKYRRLELAAENDLGLDIFNPFYDDLSRIDETIIADNLYEKMDQFGNHGPLTDVECRDYVQNVLNNISHCGAMIVIPGQNEHEVQFSMLSAKILDKKIYVVTSNHRECPWYRFYSNCLFCCWDVLVDHLSITSCT